MIDNCLINTSLLPLKDSKILADTRHLQYIQTIMLPYGLCHGTSVNGLILRLASFSYHSQKQKQNKTHPTPNPNQSPPKGLRTRVPMTYLEFSFGWHKVTQIVRTNPWVKTVICSKRCSLASCDVLYLLKGGSEWGPDIR